MNKEELKVGDVIIDINNHSNIEETIIHISKEFIYTEYESVDEAVKNNDNYRISELDFKTFKKVEPVKKYWKHVTEVEGLGFVIEYYNTNKKMSGATYLKEPTEIELKDI